MRKSVRGGVFRPLSAFLCILNWKCTFRQRRGLLKERGVWREYCRCDPKKMCVQKEPSIQRPLSVVQPLLRVDADYVWQ